MPSSGFYATSKYVNAVVVQALELLVEKCAGSVESNKSASSIILRVFECIASGLLLEGIRTSATFHVFTVISA